MRIFLFLFLIFNNFAFATLEKVWDQKFKKFVTRSTIGSTTPPTIARNTDRRPSPTPSITVNSDGTTTLHPGSDTTSTVTNSDGSTTIVTDVTSTVQDQLGTLLSETTIDQDNDVPTLLAILDKLAYIDNTTLSSILAELQMQNDQDNLQAEKVEFNELPVPEGSTNLIPENINIFESITPTGSMPYLHIQVPSLSGPQSHTIDLTNSKYDKLFLVAKAGLTAVFVLTSIKFTAWSAGSLLSS